MMKAFAARAFGGLLALAAPAPAQANVIYTFTPTTVTRTPPFALPTLGAGFALELTDDASADGAFNLIGRSGTISSGGFNPGYTGDIDEFVRLSVTSEGPTATPTSLIGSLDLSLTFSASGDVIAGRIVTLGRDTGLTLDIADNFVSGYFGSDEPSCNAPSDSRTCFESGPLVRTSVASNVPEPGSLALLGAGVLGLGLVARRRRNTTAARRDPPPPRSSSERGGAGPRARPKMGRVRHAALSRGFAAVEPGPTPRCLGPGGTGSHAATRAGAAGRRAGTKPRDVLGLGRCRRVADANLAAPVVRRGRASRRVRPPRRDRPRDHRPACRRRPPAPPARV